MNLFFVCVFCMFAIGPGRVIRTTELDPNTLYVMGFHPHGIMPVTVGVFTMRWSLLQS